MINNNPQLPTALQLWEAFRDEMSEDYIIFANNNLIDAHSRALSVNIKILSYSNEKKTKLMFYSIAHTLFVSW